jgi:hypothetical protein
VNRGDKLEDHRPAAGGQSRANMGGATQLELLAESPNRTGLQAPLGAVARSPFA